MKPMQRKSACSIVGILAVVSPIVVSAQQYPVKPVRVIVPFAPGGGVDFTGRLIAQHLSTSLGQQVVVENRGGAGGRIGTEAVVNSAPDGYTLALVSSSYPIHPSLYKLPFDPLNDISPIALAATTPFVICVHPSMPAKTVKDLIALARSRPGEINFATAGAGSGAHMATELFLLKAGVAMNHVPYKGTGPALTDLMAGQVQLTFGAAPGTLPHVKSNRLRALAVTSAQRFEADPSLPTVAESGLPGYEVLDWSGFLGPRGVPRAVVERLNAEVNAVLVKREVAERFRQAGLSAGGGEPGHFLERIRREIEVWREVVGKAKISVN